MSVSKINYDKISGVGTLVRALNESLFETTDSDDGCGAK